MTLLEKLSGDGSSYVRECLAGNPNCPVALLEKLAEDEFARGGVAANPNCPVTLLEKLSGDGSSYVRECVAGNPNCPATLLEKLAEDTDEDVRWRVALNPNCPASSFVSFLGSLSDADNEDENEFDEEGRVEPNHLPDDIREAYDEALRIRSALGDLLDDIDESDHEEEEAD